MKLRTLLTPSLGLEAAATPDERLKSFKLIYETYEPYVRRTLFWLVPKDAVDDLVQETFIRIWNKHASFRAESSPKTWIYRIAVNIAYDFLRKNRHVHTAVEDMIEGPSLTSERDVFLQHLIQKGLEILSPKHRIVFVLFYQQELTLEEISKTLRLPQGTVKSRLFHARSAYLQYLEKNGVTL